MPIFEYKCEKCGVFDVLQLGSEKPLRFCPSCAKKKKKSKVTKIVSSPAFHLKGTGWYKTDYASPGSTSKSEEGSSSRSSTKTKGVDKTVTAETSNASEKKSSDKKKKDSNTKSSSSSGPSKKAA